MNLNLKAKIVQIFGTQYAFAKEVGTHECVVSRVVRGRENLTEASKKKWADILKSDPEILFRR
jgi:plasmid maintenance system antidote protein VapI